MYLAPWIRRCVATSLCFVLTKHFSSFRERRCAQQTHVRHQFECSEICEKRYQLFADLFIGDDQIWQSIWTRWRRTHAANSARDQCRWWRDDLHTNGRWNKLIRMTISSKKIIHTRILYISTNSNTVDVKIRLLVYGAAARSIRWARFWIIFYTNCTNVSA